MKNNIKIVVITSICVIIALLIILSYILGYSPITNPKHMNNMNGTPDNLYLANKSGGDHSREKAIKLVLANAIINESIDSNNYSINNVTQIGMDDTDWHFKIGYLDDIGYYKVSISIEDGSIMGKSLVAIADINNETVPCIDYYGAKNNRLIPMTGQVIIPPNSYWYHEIGGYNEVQLTTITNGTSMYDSKIIDEKTLIKLMNDYYDDTWIITQTNHSLMSNNTQNYYNVNFTSKNQRGIYIIIKNCANKTLNINYIMAPVLRPI